RDILHLRHHVQSEQADFRADVLAEAWCEVHAPPQMEDGQGEVVADGGPHRLRPAELNLGRREAGAEPAAGAQRGPQGEAADDGVYPFIDIRFIRLFWNPSGLCL